MATRLVYLCCLWLSCIPVNTKYSNGLKHQKDIKYDDKFNILFIYNKMIIISNYKLYNK
jgi:hypothetical protein